MLLPYAAQRCPASRGASGSWKLRPKPQYRFHTKHAPVRGDVRAHAGRKGKEQEPDLIER